MLLVDVGMLLERTCMEYNPQDLDFQIMDQHYHVTLSALPCIFFSCTMYLVYHVLYQHCYHVFYQHYCRVLLSAVPCNVCECVYKGYKYIVCYNLIKCSSTTIKYRSTRARYGSTTTKYRSSRDKHMCTRAKYRSTAT